MSRRTTSDSQARTELFSATTIAGCARASRAISQPPDSRLSCACRSAALSSAALALAGRREGARVSPSASVRPARLPFSVPSANGRAALRYLCNMNVAPLLLPTSFHPTTPPARKINKSQRAETSTWIHLRARARATFWMPVWRVGFLMSGKQVSGRLDRRLSGRTQASPRGVLKAHMLNR